MVVLPPDADSLTDEDEADEDIIGIVDAHDVPGEVELQYNTSPDIIEEEDEVDELQAEPIAGPSHSVPNVPPRLKKNSLQIWILSFVSAINLVTSGYLTGHHPLPSNLIAARNVIGSAIASHPSSGAYSSSQLTQTISNSPHQIQSTISTYYPLNYDGRENLNSYHNQRRKVENPVPYLSQFTPNRLYNPSQSSIHNANHQSAITYSSYDIQRPRNYNQNQIYYQSQNNGYNEYIPESNNIKEY